MKDFAKNREFWGNYFKDKPKRTGGDIALMIANAKKEHGAKNAEDWLKKARAHKKREGERF